MRVDRGAGGARRGVGRHVRDLVVAEGDLVHHLVRRRVRQRVVGQLVDVAVGVGAVPQDLDDRQQQRPLELARVGRVQRHGVEREVLAAGQQRGVVDARYAENATVDVGRDGEHGAAVDAALAVAVVVRPGRVDERLEAVALVDLERRVRDQALRVDHQPREVEEVELALLHVVGERREAVHVGVGLGRGGDVDGRHPLPVGRAVHEAVLLHHVRDLALADLALPAEQPVAVERRPHLLRVGESNTRLGTLQVNFAVETLPGICSGVVWSMSVGA